MSDPEGLTALNVIEELQVDRFKDRACLKANLQPLIVGDVDEWHREVDLETG